MSGHFPPHLKPQRQFKSARSRARSNSSQSRPTVRKKKLDITQRLEKKVAQYATSNSIVKIWLFEITSLLIALGCFIGMIAIYHHTSNEKLLGHADLIAYANVLGKITSVALILPVTEALGQLKWHWFHKANAMWDFEIFDKATRGPWGAFLLLYRTRGRSLAALGAMLVLLLLANDSFLQRVIDLPSRPALLDLPSEISTTVRYDIGFGKQFRDGSEIATDDPDLFLVIEKFSYGNGTIPGFYNDGARADIPLVSIYVLHLSLVADCISLVQRVTVLGQNTKHWLFATNVRTSPICSATPGYKARLIGRPRCKAGSMSSEDIRLAVCVGTSSTVRATSRL